MKLRLIALTVLPFCAFAPDTRAGWLDEFSWRAPHPHSLGFRSILTVDGVRVLAGDRGALVSGPVNALRPFIHDHAENFTGLAHSADRWVAVAGDIIATSADGAAWTFAVPPAAVHDVLFDNGLFIAVGAGIHVSTDGLTWTPATTPDLEYHCGSSPFCSVTGFTQVFKVGTEYWAIANTVQQFQNDLIVTSPDGLVWTESSDAGTGNHVFFNSVRYGSYDYFLSKGAGQFVTPASKLWLRSAGGVLAEATLTLPETPVWVGLAAREDAVEAVAVSGMVVSSANGLTWSVVTPPAALDLTGIEVSATGFTATAANGGVLAWSRSSETWVVTSQISSALNFIYQVAFGNGVFIAVGNDIFLRSLDGKTWDAVPDKHDGWSRVLFENGRFLALGTNGRIEHSPDGYNWSTTHAGNLRLRDAAYGEGRWIAVGPKSDDDSMWETYTSTDLLDWTLVPVPIPLTEVEYGNGIFAGPGLVSEDGLVWELVASVLLGGPSRRIKFHDGTFWSVLGTAHSAYVTSSDGRTWTRIAPGAQTGIIEDYLFDPHSEALIAIHTLQYSIGTTLDGVDFTFYNALPDNSSFVTGLASGLGTIVAVGSNGRIFQSGVNPLATPARPANLSTRSPTSDGADIQIAGFAIPDGGPKRVLVRAAGPALGGLGVGDFVADPRLAVFDGPDEIAANDDWEDDGHGADLEAAFALVGAFEFADGSKDAALLLDLASGGYTAQVSGGTGITLVEVYAIEAAGTNPAPLANLSTRARSDATEGIVIGGIVIAGETAQRVLIRAIGPGIEQYGVASPMADPLIEIYRGGVLIDTIAAWSAAPNLEEIAAAAASVGAFELEPGSLDAAGIRALSPGSYTFHIRSAAGASGIVLFETYRLFED